MNTKTVHQPSNIWELAIGDTRVRGVRVKGEWWFSARKIGLALGYQYERGLTNIIHRNDVFRGFVTTLTGDALSEAFALDPTFAEPGAYRLVVLAEEGVRMALWVARTEIAARLRREGVPGLVKPGELTRSDDHPLDTPQDDQPSTRTDDEQAVRPTSPSGNASRRAEVERPTREPRTDHQSARKSNTREQHEAPRNFEVKLASVPNEPGLWHAHINGTVLPMSTRSDDAKPRARDIDLAVWMGFKTPRMIRKIIKSMESKGKLRGVEWRSAVERQLTNGGGVREYTVMEAWLTREQALLVATQSDAPRAWEVTEAMAAVFDAFLDGRVGPQFDQEAMVTRICAQVIAAVLPELRKHSAPPEGRIDDVEERVGHIEKDVASGVIGAEIAEREILLPIRLVSSDKHTGKLNRSVWFSYHQRLRHEVEWNGEGKTVDQMPRNRLARAQRFIKQMQREVDADRRRQIRAAQSKTRDEKAARERARDAQTVIDFDAKRKKKAEGPR